MKNNLSYFICALFNLHNNFRQAEDKNPAHSFLCWRNIEGCFRIGKLYSKKMDVGWLVGWLLFFCLFVFCFCFFVFAFIFVAVLHFMGYLMPNHVYRNILFVTKKFKINFLNDM